MRPSIESDRGSRSWIAPPDVPAHTMRAERRRCAAPSVQRPRLTFRDLELLHHRCIALRNVPGLNLITRADREYRSVR